MPPGQASATPYTGFQGIYRIGNSVFSGYYAFLDTGEYYIFDTDASGIGGLGHGDASGSATSITSSDMGFYDMSDQPSDGFLLSGPATFTVTLAGGVASSSENYPAPIGVENAGGPALTYSSTDSRTVYDNPIALGALAGTYNGTLGSVGTDMPRTPFTGLTLDAAGAFAVTASNCRFAGTLAPHGSTGVFDLVATASGTGCPLGGTMSGVAIPLSYAGANASLAFEMYTPNATQAAVLQALK